jgi:hypothetical protein
MTHLPPGRPVNARRQVAIAIGLALVLSGCTSFLGPKIDIIEGKAGAPPATVDPGAAAAKISAYRKSKGLPPVTVSATLNGIARDQAQAMASAGKMAHVLPGQGSFASRLSRGGYDAAIAAENIAAGPQNLDQAFDSWRKSSGHNANLLKAGVTEIGIAVAYRADGKFHDYWSLVLAAPDDRKVTMGGPDAGPLVAASR